MFTRRLVAMDVWVSITCAITALNLSRSEELYLPMTFGLYLLTSHKCLNQTAYSNFEDRKCWSLGFFELVYGSEAIFVLVCPASYIYEQYPIAE